ncbi:MAG: SurA N-terminal domain-containing protein [Deltaproteobacteria bacterium]|nr:SurA N-terminal domain-containing protein [Deltaproteobacteria bacterium]MBI3296338.1 SurA N-terminal domain-containing protein [Deltaproteobacteria bacterium]
MLDSIRKRKDNFIYSGIILVTAAVMGFYGVGKMASDSKEGGVAAWVNGDPISERDVQQEMERRVYQYQTLFGGQFDPRMLGPDFPKQILDQLVRSKLLAQQAKKMSLIVTDEELADFIREIPAYQKDGKFDATRYTQIQNRGILEKGWRERLELGKFQDYLSGRVSLTPAELARTHALKETKIDLSYARINFQNLAKNRKATDKELAEFVKATPESEFQGYYDGHKSDYTEKSKVQLRQIRVGIPYQASENQKADAKKKIDAIHAEITPAKFSEVAKKRSDDEYAKKGGDAGWVIVGSLEKPLEDAIAQLKPNEISPPVQASFGHFIFQLVARKEGREKPLSEVRAGIAEKLYADKHAKEFGETTRKKWDDMLASGKDIESELKAQKIEVKKTGPFSIGQAEIPGIGNSESIVDAAFELSPGRPLPKSLLFFQDNYFYVKLAKLEPAKSFDASKDTEALERSAKNQIENQILQDWVGQLEKKASKKIEMKFAATEEPTAVQ